MDLKMRLGWLIAEERQRGGHPSPARVQEHFSAFGVLVLVTPENDGLIVKTHGVVPEELRIDHIEGLPITYVATDA
jgi:hypothetical protein